MMSRESKWTLMAVAGAGLAIFFGLPWARSRDGGGSRSASPTSMPRAEDRFAVEEGGRLYAHYCQACHGESGRGDGRFYASSLEPTPADFTAPAFHSARTDDQLHTAIAGGSRRVGRSDLCPAWEHTFSSTEVGYLVTYIRRLQGTQETAPANAFR